MPTEPKKSEPNTRQAPTVRPLGSVARSAGSRTFSMRVRDEIRMMNSRLARTRPTWTATVRSKTTVSRKVASITTR